jgi:hypothetical protein
MSTMSGRLTQLDDVSLTQLGDDSFTPLNDVRFVCTKKKIPKVNVNKMNIEQILSFIFALTALDIQFDYVIYERISEMVIKSKYTWGRRMLQGVRALKMPRFKIVQQWTPPALPWRTLTDQEKIAHELNIIDVIDDVYYRKIRSEKEISIHCPSRDELYSNMYRYRETALNSCKKYLSKIDIFYSDEDDSEVYSEVYSDYIDYIEECCICDKRNLGDRSLIRNQENYWIKRGFVERGNKGNKGNKITKRGKTNHKSDKGRKQ